MPMRGPSHRRGVTLSNEFLKMVVLLELIKGLKQ